MGSEIHPLTQFDIDYITQTVAPGGLIVAADQLEGGVSATITHLEFALPDGEARHVIVRQQGAFDLSGNPGLALDEETLLRALRQHGLPVPEPLLSETGFCGGGSTWLVCEFIEGDTITEPPFPDGFVDQIASTLAGIHAIDAGLDEMGFLEDGHFQAWTKVDSHARSTSRHQQAEKQYWQALEAHFPDTPDEPRALLHGDYWPGNMIWKDGKLAGVIDWEDARLGDPLEDVANCRLELLLTGGAELANAFTEAYRRLRPETRFDGFRFWELYVAARLLRRIPEWELDEAKAKTMSEQAATFANDALSGLGSE